MKLTQLHIDYYYENRPKRGLLKCFNSRHRLVSSKVIHKLINSQITKEGSTNRQNAQAGCNIKLRKLVEWCRRKDLKLTDVLKKQIIPNSPPMSKAVYTKILLKLEKPL